MVRDKSLHPKTTIENEKFDLYLFDVANSRNNDVIGQAVVNSTFHSSISATRSARHIMKSITLQSRISLEYVEQGASAGTKVIFCMGIPTRGSRSTRCYRC